MLNFQVKFNEWVSQLIMLLNKCKELLSMDSHFGQFLENKMALLDAIKICKELTQIETYNLCVKAY
jgi:hypothetical protein